ncbi:MAG: ATP-binding protein [Candidatus Sericytochromatia bacterium]|nr:ATP-binding protein [Candidatus Sericytochromatia bacterium]
MQRTDGTREVSLTIPIIPDMEVAATQTAEAVLRLMAFSADQIDEVKHALIEACINAFEHSASRDGNVYIRFVMRPDELRLVIQDFGTGFDQATVQRPEMARKVGGGDHKRGWGLMMMQSLMDAVAIESGEAGTRITMTKKRHEEGSA